MQRSLSPNITISSSQQMSNTGTNSPAKHSSPTPLAFTPTSVLRKMTAEKEPELNMKENKDLNKTVGNIQNMRHSQTPQHQLNRPNVGINWNAINKQPQGRPIKGGGAPASQMQFASNLEYQQQQMQFNQSMNPQRSKLTVPPQGHNIQVPYNYPTQFTNLMQQQRQSGMGNGNHGRAQELHAQFAHAQALQLQQHKYQQQYQQQMLSGARPKQGVLGFNQRDGGLSPTSNQLARWFSPELLAQASAGKLPAVNIPRDALSLEELERIQQSSTTVHN